MSWLSAIGSMFTYLGGESLGSSLLRVALTMGVANYLNKQNESASSAGGAAYNAQSVRQQISPATENKIPVAYGDSYFSGTIFDVQLVNDNRQLYAALALCEQTGDVYSSSPNNPAARVASSITIDNIYLNGQRITFMADGTTIDYTTDDTGVVDSNAHGLVGIYLYKGGSNAPMLPCQPGTVTPIAGTVPTAAYTIMPGWTASTTAQNTVFAIVKLNYDPSKGLKSIPDLKFHVRNTLNKPGDVLHDYMTNEMYGAGIPEAYIDNATITAVNAYSDESITLGAYPAQARYRVNGLVQTSSTVLDNMGKLASTAGSYVSYDIGTGKWAIYTNRAGVQSLSFNDSNIIGQINVTGSNLDAYYNRVEVQFPYAYLKDQNNFINFELPEIFRNANEPSNTLQLNHEFVNNVVQATVLANLDLRQTREDMVVTFKTDYSKYNVQIGDVVGVTNSVYGWTNKLFRIIRVKKADSDAGELTLEITGQTYNSDVYTVEDISDFVPLIGVGHSIPALSPIATPVAPTAVVTTLSSQPSIVINAVVPAGVVTEMEFWYTKDTEYTLLGSMRAENSGPFLLGATPAFKTVLLNSGTYYFKVRAVNEAGSSAFSAPSAATPYTYTQAPDVLPYNVPVLDQNGQELPGDGLNMGMLAAYVATKLNWFGEGGIFSGNATIKSIFGIGDEAVAQIETAVQADTNIGNVAPGFYKATAGGSTMLSSNVDTLNFVAGPGTADGSKIVVTGVAGTNTVMIDLALGANLAIAANTTPDTGGTGNVVVPPPAPTTITSTLNGKVFPMVFGSGPTDGAVDSRAGIFTHDHLVFAGSNVGGLVKSDNVITSSKALTVAASGLIRDFYKFPSLANNWSRKPWYNDTLTDKYAYGSKVTIYYSTATYTSGNLDAQSWSPWTLCGSNDGVTGFNGNVTVVVPATYANTYSNPQPTVSSIVTAPYIVEEIMGADGSGTSEYVSGTFPGSNTLSDYDPFKANVLIVNQLTPETTRIDSYSTLAKATGVAVSNGNTTITFPGGATDLIMFGISVFNPPTGTAVSSNTVFAHATPFYVNSFPEAKPFKQIASNGTRFVGISAVDSRVYWSDDGIKFDRIKLDADVTNSPTWDSTAFEFIGWDGSKFLAHDLQNGCATSTDGKTWTEYSNSTLSAGTIQVCVTTGHYVAVGTAGIQTSADGIVWNAVSNPIAPAMPKTVVWTGSMYLLGAARTNMGYALYTGTNGTTWTALEQASNPTASQTVDTANYTSTQNSIDLMNSLTTSLLP